MADFEKHRYIVAYNLGGYFGYSREIHQYAIMRYPQDAVLFDDLTSAYEKADAIGNCTVKTITCKYYIGDECERIDDSDTLEKIVILMPRGIDDE